MSERIVHVYRTSVVAEYVVDDDGIYEDDVDMLRDVVEAARAGLLEFVVTDAEFVVMTWGEDSAMTVRAVFPEGSVEARRPAESTVDYCPRCLEPQLRLEGGGVTCPRGHDGLPGIGRGERARKFVERWETREESGDPSPTLPTSRTRTRRKPRERRSR